MSVTSLAPWLISATVPSPCIYSLFVSASEVWEQCKISSDLRNATGVRQGKAPVELPPALGSPSPASEPVPVPTSGSFSWLCWKKLDAHLHLSVLILLLY